MRRIIYLIGILALAMSASAYAQHDPEALAKLDAMSEKYKKMGAYTVSFTQELTNETADLNETIKGDITIKGDKYLLNIAGQEIYNNGEEVWTYNDELNEVTVTTYNPEEGEISLSNIYDLYKEGFKYALIGETEDGDSIVELNPDDRSKSYYKIRMIINGQDELEKFIIFEKSGNKYIYTINKLKEEPNLPDSYFTFDPAKHPDTEVIDFR